MSKQSTTTPTSAVVVPFVRAGGRGQAAVVQCEPKPKGNSKQVLPVGKRCRVCKQAARHVLVPRKQDKQAEKLLADLLRTVAPDEPFAVDVKLWLTIRLPIRPSWSKKKREAAEAGRHRPTSAKGATGPIPDLGNLEKCVEDALESAGWLTNDSLIAKRESEKLYGTEPGIWVAVQELPTWKA